MELPKIDGGLWACVASRVNVTGHEDSQIESLQSNFQESVAGIGKDLQKEISELKNEKLVHTKNFAAVQKLIMLSMHSRTSSLKRPAHFKDLVISFSNSYCGYFGGLLWFDSYCGLLGYCSAEMYSEVCTTCKEINSN